MFDLHRKVAVVTGAGSGIGAAIAALFARQGARTVVLDVNETAQATADAIRAAGGDAIARRCDVSAPDDVRSAFHDLDGELGRLDILVNNAGIAHVGTIEQTSPDDLDRLYAVNVRGEAAAEIGALRVDDHDEAPSEQIDFHVADAGALQAPHDFRPHAAVIRLVGLDDRGVVPKVGRENVANHAIGFMRREPRRRWDTPGR
ncbi:MAG: hypothetical protein DMF96_12265 [Acidobacteria bacterium]|nr:MAG: hypothetical protein DMF96_12265 [Acidobacteriota bacterium]